MKNHQSCGRRGFTQNFVPYVVVGAFIWSLWGAFQYTRGVDMRGGGIAQQSTDSD